MAPAARRAPHFISPSALSVTLSVDNAAPAVENAPATGSLTTTITVPAPVGKDTFAIALFDGANGGGNLLGKVAVAQTVALGTLNTVAATVNGQLAKIGVFASSPFVEGSLANGFTLVGDQMLQLSLVPEDADGNAILMPGEVPALTLSTTGTAITAAPASAADAYVLQGVAPSAAQPFVASGKNLDGGTVQVTFDVSALAALYVTQYRSQTVLVYDENGTQLTLPQTAFEGASNPQGIAVIPGASPGVGRLAVADATDSEIFTYDESGNPAALGASAFGGTNQPFYLSFDSKRSALLVPDYQADSMSAFNAEGQAEAPGSFPMMSQPISVTYDSHADAAFVVNFGPETLAKYSGAGAPLVASSAAPSAGSHAMGGTFDSNNDEIYIADAGYPVVEIPEGGTVEPSRVNAFTEADAAVTVANLTSGITTFTGLTYASDIVFDPYTRNLLVTDAGANKTLAFTEAGASVTLSGAAPFADQSEPEGIVLVP